MPTPGAPELDGVWELVREWPVTRAAAAVVHRDGGVVGVYGDRKEVFQLASVSKLLTAHAALVAIEERTMSLADPVGPPGATVRHLLSHASGLGPEGDVLAEPEQRRIYSNAGFELVGQELSDRSAIPVERYMHEAVAAPLGMTDTRLEGSPAYGVVSSIGDMAVFAVELMSPRLVSAGTLDEATRVVFPGLPGVLPGFGYMEPNDWGLGFELKAEKSPHWTSPGNSGRTFGHFGALGTFLWVDPDPGLALVVLTDRQFGPWAQRRWPELSSAVLAAAG